jgi:hypothetical protein
MIVVVDVLLGGEWSGIIEDSPNKSRAPSSAESRYMEKSGFLYWAA